MPTLVVFAILLFALLFVCWRAPIFGWILTAGAFALGIYLVAICPPAPHSSHGISSRDVIELGYQLSFFGAMLVGMVTLASTLTRRARRPSGGQVHVGSISR